jgi:fructose-1,6-bisphosphatase/inositol monophosphatase family enzyme
MDTDPVTVVDSDTEDVLDTEPDNEGLGDGLVKEEYVDDSDGHDVLEGQGVPEGHAV